MCCVVWFPSRWMTGNEFPAEYFRSDNLSEELGQLPSIQSFFSLPAVSLSAVASGMMAHSSAWMCFSIFFLGIYHIFQVRWKSLEDPAVAPLCFVIILLASPLSLHPSHRYHSRHPYLVPT